MKNLFLTIYYKLISANKVALKVGVKFGKNCHFGSKYFGSEPYLIEIGNDFKTSANVKYITHDGSVNVLRNLYPELKDIDLFAKIKIGNNVFLGLDVVVLPGTIIEDNVIVGAGSIVRGHLQRNSVYAGVPVKFICTLEEYKLKHENTFVFTKHMKADEKYIFLKRYFGR